ncbi:IQ and ubiquitin-like domain-containing protein isoform X1 [Carcharodon carcharias]|uniref:IQ and ubiquitin-like domain-containing protein isoform X1 n=1 Tax=Carcharodon carcharias TaxID=13397 RepID=UPI001B7ECEC8|nr:IQ and ubiquitin-like domain-containing protein isoform X1 [Carcharodon carcharias]XP_041072080.1 IQ and ubiquitin-like domain-containing protein isoform X1 [Carcharodon carcharias]
MAENDGHIQEAKEQSNAPEKEENPSDQATEVHEVSEEGPPVEPAVGTSDTRPIKYDNAESPSESSEFFNYDTGESSASAATLFDEETANKTSHETVSLEVAGSPTEDSETVGHDIGGGPTDEVTTDETVGVKDVTIQEAVPPDHVDITKPDMPREGLIIIDCSKTGVGEGTKSLDSPLLVLCDQSKEKPEDMTVDEDIIILDCTKYTTTESPVPVISKEKPEEEQVTEPSMTCEELREKLEAQIAAIEAVHGRSEVEKPKKAVSKGTDTAECLVYRTPPTAADRDLKKRSVLQSYPPLPKTPSPDIASSTATVKVALLPTGDVMTVALPICLTVGKLKARFGKELKVPACILQMTCDGRMAKDSETLVDLGVRPHGSIQLELASSEPEKYPIKLIRPQQESATSDVITVTVQKDDETCCSVVVEIERLPYHKPFLGGYKHRPTGKEFHHAGTQTPLKRRTNCCVEKFCRETQTVSDKNQYQQTANDTSTQMTKIGCYVSNITDKLITPGKYFTAAEYYACRLKAVIVLQTYFRRWAAKNYVQQLRMQKSRRVQWELEQELKVKMEKQNYIKKQYERRMNPKTKEDFDLLFHALEVWKQEELSNINRTLTGPERKAALYTLLEQEAQLIASISRHKVDAAKETGPKLIQNLLNKCADPIRWKAYDGRVTEMDTPFTIRARELRDIYNSINMKYLTQDERLDALLTLKHTVKEHDCKLTQEIVELIDREADLLMRQVKESYLEGLRQRISTLFLQYIKTPTFNPEVARFLKVPQDPMQLRKNVYFCLSCGSYLPSTEFPLSLTSQTLRMCRQCFKLNNEARRREEVTMYKLMLKRLRKTEANFEDGSQLAFLLQEQDMKHLVDSIWGTQSALSASNSLKDLTMIRWDKRFEWSPWNCILLTEEEAVAHLKISNIEKDYEATFIRKIKHRHTLGKTYFSRIPEIVNYAHTCLMQDLTSKNNLRITNSFSSKQKS